MKILVGDTVVVRTGKDKGKTGKVLAFTKDKKRVLVEGVGAVIKHVKPRQGAEGGRVETFAPIDVSNVGVLDEKSGKASRVGYSFDKAGVKSRMLKSTGAVLPNNFSRSTKGKTV